MHVDVFSKLTGKARTGIGCGWRGPMETNAEFLFRYIEFESGVLG